MSRRPAFIPAGSWPRRMGAELAAAYCGELSVDAFIKRVGSEYPRPRIARGAAAYGSKTTSTQRSCLPN